MLRAALPPRSLRLLGALAAVAVLVPAVAHADLKTAKDFYEFGNYARAITELEALLYPSSQLGSEEEVLAHTLLGASYFFQKNPERAKEEFESVLRLKPVADLDPFKFPPDMVKIFTEVKTEISAGKERILRDSMAKRFSGALVSGSELLERQEALTPRFYAVTVERHNPAFSFIPVIGQLQNGDEGRALGLLGAELASVGTAIGTYAYLKQVTGPVNPTTGKVPCLVDPPNLVFDLTGPQLCSLARGANLGALAVSAGLIGLGIYDARRRYVPEVLRLDQVPPEVGKRLQKQVQRLELRPDFVAGGGLGLSLGSEF
jgi:hypothetical protein